MAIRKLKFSFLPMPEEIMRDKKLSFGAKYLFGIFAKTNFEEIKWSKKYLAKRMDCSYREVFNRIKELEENNLIQVIRSGKGKVNRYIINFELINILQKEEQESSKKDEQEIHEEEMNKCARGAGTNVHGGSEDSMHDIKEHSLKKIIKENNKLSPQELEFKKEIDHLINKFKKINPSYEKLFGNKTQRKSIENLIEKLGPEKLEKLIDFLPSIFGKPYAPRITTPYQLEEKLGDLIAYIKSERSKKPKIGIVR